MADVSSTSKYVAETLGTFALVFAVGCNVLQAGPNPFGIVAIASTLMVMIYALGGISGGHFNPAVSFCVALADKSFGWDQFGIYSACQIVGGCLGGLAYGALYGHTFPMGPAGGFSWYDACLAETFYTFMLTFTVLNVALAKKSQPNEYFGIAIAFTVVAGGYGAGKISGGCFNPAVAFALDIVSAGWSFGWCFMYWAAELLGAAIAYGLYIVCRPEESGSGEGTIAARLTSEFIGTFMLVLTVGLNVAVAPADAAVFSIAASLMCMIYALGNVSGGHFNPAVTVAILLSGRDKIGATDALMYIATQLVAGVLAGLTFSGMVGGVSIGGNWGQIAVAEICFTFVLCYTVLCVATTRAALAHFFALAIGFCVVVGGYSIGHLSGGHLNPAVSFGLDVSGFHFAKCWGYLGAQMIGGGAAAGAFAVTHANEFGKTFKAVGGYGSV